MVDEGAVEGQEAVKAPEVPETPAEVVTTPIWEVIKDLGDRLGALEASDPRVKEIRELIYRAADLAKG